MPTLTQADFKSSMYWRMVLNFGFSSYFCLLSAENAGVSHHTQFLWHWGWNSGLCACYTYILQTELHAQPVYLYLRQGLGLLRLAWAGLLRSRHLPASVSLVARTVSVACCSKLLRFSSFTFIWYMNLLFTVSTLRKSLIYLLCRAQECHIMLGDKCVYVLSHLAGPSTFFFLSTIYSILYSQLTFLCFCVSIYNMCSVCVHGSAEEKAVVFEASGTSEPAPSGGLDQSIVLLCHKNSLWLGEGRS